MIRRSMMRPLVPALLVFTLLTPTSIARGAEEATESPMRPGAWAVQFGIGDNFSLESFAGGALAIKHHSSAYRAWRAGVSLGASDFGRDFSVEFPDTTTLEEEDFDNQSIGAELDVLHYFGTGPMVRPYFGFGPRASWSHQGRTTESEERDAHTWSVGVGGLFGAEYRAASAIGIHAEYRYAFNYNSRTDEIRGKFPGSAVTRIEDSGWYLSSGGVRFGLSAYF